MDFGRVVTAMITPMHDDYSVSYDGAQKLAAHLLQNGSDSLVITGSTGESPTLKADEKVKLYAAVREVMRGTNKKLIAGTSGSDTAAAVELSKQAEAVGVDAILAVVPPYNKPQQEGLYQHFRAIAQAVSLPVILYNVPGRTMVNMLPETVARLAEIDNIVALKEATADVDQTARIRLATPPDFIIYSGDDNAVLPMMTLGARGIISVAAHLIGKEMQEMLLAFEKGDNARATELHYRYYDVFCKCFITSNPVPVKYCLNRLGLPAGPCRLPLVDADAKAKAILDEMLQDIGLL